MADNRNNSNGGGQKKNNNNNVAAAAVGGAIVGAGAAALATKALSDPKNRKKVQDVFDETKARIMDLLADLQNKVDDAGEVAGDKMEEGKVEVQKALKAGKRKSSK